MENKTLLKVDTSKTNAQSRTCIIKFHYHDLSAKLENLPFPSILQTLRLILYNLFINHITLTIMVWWDIGNETQQFVNQGVNSFLNQIK